MFVSAQCLTAKLCMVACVFICVWMNECMWGVYLFMRASVYERVLTHSPTPYVYAGVNVWVIVSVCACVSVWNVFFLLWLGLVRTYMHVWIYSIYIYLYEYMRCLQQSTHSQAVSVWEFRFLSDFITITKRTYCSRSHTIQQTVISIFHPMRTQFEVICNNAICILQA